MAAEDRVNYSDGFPEIKSGPHPPFVVGRRLVVLALAFYNRKVNHWGFRGIAENHDICI